MPYGLVNRFIDHLHHSELQVITALSLISTIYKSLQATFSPAFGVSNSRLLETDSNSGNSSASCSQVPSSQHSVQNSPTRLNCQRQSQSYFTTGGLPPTSLSWCQVPLDPRPEICFSPAEPLRY
jgi:hypothetical protein